MARTPEDQAAEAAAQKSVRFDPADILLVPKAVSQKNSTLRRRSTLGAATGGPTDDTGTHTLGADDDNDDGGEADVVDDKQYTLTEYKEWRDANIDKFRYTVDSGALVQDLQQRVADFAAYCAKRGDAFPFKPLSEGAKTHLNWVDLLKYETFATVADDDEKMRALFDELRLRSMMLSVALEQVDELNMVGKKLAVSCEHLDGWAEHFGAAVDTLKADKPGRRRRDKNTKSDRGEDTGGTATGADPPSDGPDSSDSDSSSDPDDESDKSRSDLTELLQETMDALTDEKAKSKAKDKELADLRQLVAHMAIERHREGTPASSSTSNSIVSAGGTRTTKLADVPIYYNDKEKDTTTFETWHRNIENKLDGNADHFPTDRLRMTYIEGRLGGRAASDLQPYLRSTHPDQIKSSSALLKHLWEEYFDENIKEDSLKKYNNLELRAGEDIRAFKNEFVRLAGEIRRDKASWKEEFNSRLYSGLQTVLTRDYVDPAVSFDTFARLAVKIVGNWARNKESRKEEAPKKDKKRDRDSNRGGRAKGTGAKSTTAFTKPTAGEAVRLRAEGKCYLCRGKGHRAKDCDKTEPQDDAAAINAMIERLYKQQTESSEN